MDKENAVVQLPLSASLALARLLSAFGLGNDGGEASCGEEGVEPGAGGENEGDRGDDEGAPSDDSFPPPRGPPALLLLSGLPGVVLYRSAVLHGDGAGGDGALVRRW